MLAIHANNMKWWRRRESNPRPKQLQLQVFYVVFFEVWTCNASLVLRTAYPISTWLDYSSSRNARSHLCSMT